MHARTHTHVHRTFGKRKISLLNVLWEPFCKNFIWYLEDYFCPWCLQWPQEHLDWIYFGTNDSYNEDFVFSWTVINTVLIKWLFDSLDIYVWTVSKRFTLSLSSITNLFTTTCTCLWLNFQWLFPQPPTPHHNWMFGRCLCSWGQRLTVFP